MPAWSDIQHITDEKGRLKALLVPLPELEADYLRTEEALRKYLQDGVEREEGEALLAGNARVARFWTRVLQTTLSTSFRELLDDWTDDDGAMFQLAITLGLIDKDVDFAHLGKARVLGDPFLRNLLGELLKALEKAQVLEVNDDRQVRWNPRAPRLQKRIPPADPR